jgi:AT hook motif
VSSDLRQAAIDALGDVLRAPDAKPADRLRAAEAILRSASSGDLPGAGLDALTDDALLLIARGEEGGTPPERGPSAPRAAAVPSHAPAEPPGLVRPANPLLRRGPKEDPQIATPPGEGPKEDPAKKRPRGRPPKNQLSSPAAQAGELEPWM